MVRSATILPGVPLPTWALPEAPIAPEPTPEPAPAPAPPDLVEEAESLELEEAGAFAAFSVPMALAANGPAPMRSGWGFPRRPSEPVEDPTPQLADADATSEIPVVPDDLAGLAELADPLVPLDAPDPQTLVPAPVAEPATDAMPEDPDPDASTETLGDDGTPGASRRRLVLVGALGTVVVAAAVAAFVWPGLLVTADPEPVARPATAAPVLTPARVTLAAPAQVGGLTRVSGAADTALSAATTTTALPGLTAPVSGVYGIGTTPVVTVIAWKNGASLDAAAIAAAFAGFEASSGAEVSDVVTVTVGELEGQMRCGTTVVSATPASLCFWVDDASFGSVTVLRPASPEAGAETAIAVRAKVETTS